VKRVRCADQTAATAGSLRAALASLQTPIADLKAVLEAALSVPVDRQRLIYRGRVLRDENTLQELGECVEASQQQMPA
jgi:hypothetical protein